MPRFVRASRRAWASKPAGFARQRSGRTRRRERPLDPGLRAVICSSGATVSRRNDREVRSVPESAGFALSLRHLVVRSLALLAIGALALQGCRGESAPPNIVLILVDQLRADRVGVYGSPLGLTPRLDRMAREGFYFLRARSPAPWTYPAVVSLHTGLYPRAHGASRLKTDDHGWWISKVSQEVTTLAEHLEARGYATAGFIANPYLKPESNFPQGFDHYEHDFVDLWALDPANDNDHWWKGSSYANTLNPRVLRFANQSLEQPQFIYVHYIDVHGPWDDAPFLADPCPAIAECSEANRMAPGMIYFRSIHYIDRKIGDLYEALDARFDGNLLFVVTSDHGRTMQQGDLSNRFKVDKASLHDYNLWVPLIFAPTRFFGHRGSTADNVSLVDVLPTLLDLAFADAAEVETHDISLVPSMRGEPLPDRTLLAESDDHAVGYRAEAAIRGDSKFISVLIPERAYFEYDLRADPLELADPLDALSAIQKERLLDLELRLEAIAKQSVPSTPATLDERTVEQLRALGYTD